MIIVTAIREKQEHFLQQIVHFVNPVMVWVPGFFFNPTDRPNIRKCIRR